ARRAERAQAAVGGDPVQPGAQRGAAVVPGQTPPGVQQGLLERVLGILERAEHPVAVHLQFTAVRLGQRPERLAVTGPHPADQIHARLLAPCRPHRVRKPPRRRTGRAAGDVFFARPASGSVGTFTDEGESRWAGSSSVRARRSTGSSRTRSGPTVVSGSPAGSTRWPARTAR